VKFFAWRHLVGFQDTNLVGNVYFVNHLSWQGRCRELFLKQHAPQILARLQQGFALATVRCSCDYLVELEAFDEVELRMSLKQTSRNQIAMDFAYWRLEKGGGETLVARGQQQVACMERRDGQMVPVPIPQELSEALAAYQ